MNKLKTNQLMRRCSTILLTVLVGSLVEAQTPIRSRADHPSSRRKTQSVFPWTLMPGASSLAPAAGPNLPVLGNGTLGRLPKWTRFVGITSIIGDSTIFENSSGNVGIGTDAPTSRLTIAGMIETKLGGLKFPDGTVQTTAAVSGLPFVEPDSTLRGTGVASSPLGLAIPLNLTESAPNKYLVQITNGGDGGDGVRVQGGDRGEGIRALGGASNGSFAGGGDGVIGIGGNATGSGQGGRGAAFVGGDSTSAIAGVGVEVGGGNSDNDHGGDGVRAFGGVGTGPGKTGGIGIFAAGGAGDNGAADGLAGLFQGGVQILGNLSKGGGSFKIDHPLDPENKYLYHSFVESPDMKNIYDGIVTTDANGDATVQLPDYFEALNRDFRYQLTVVGTFAQAIVAQKIKGNRFTIKTNAPNVEVSWLVTGIRQDAYANKHRIPVEEAKAETERGSYLHPEAFGRTEEKSVLYLQHPEMDKRMRSARETRQKEPE
ncbi:MAG TPA: hypothetical protein VFV34_24500 [Blastocatellia bacterium]|nr:hypothetical protein [Blastocatellia bacterium]